MLVVFDSDPTTVAKAAKLKKELQRLMKAIVDSDLVNLFLNKAKEVALVLLHIKITREAFLPALSGEHEP
ncbi:hypothetical protein EV2_014662 [Malus domestica]